MKLLLSILETLAVALVSGAAFFALEYYGLMSYGQKNLHDSLWTGVCVATLSAFVWAPASYRHRTNQKKPGSR